VPIISPENKILKKKNSFSAFINVLERQHEDVTSKGQTSVLNQKSENHPLSSTLALLTLSMQKHYSEGQMLPRV